jgi:ADP-ribosyl-[dinitrogen reductase] hydrolase
MRVLPVALVGRDQPDASLISQAHRASRVTHGHPRAQVCCALYVLIAKRLVQGSGRAAALASKANPSQIQQGGSPPLQ